jgi:hypothetical protein
MRKPIVVWKPFIGTINRTEKMAGNRNTCGTEKVNEETTID